MKLQEIVSSVENLQDFMDNVGTEHFGTNSALHGLDLSGLNGLNILNKALKQQCALMIQQLIDTQGFGGLGFSASETEDIENAYQEDSAKLINMLSQVMFDGMSSEVTSYLIDNRNNMFEVSDSSVTDYPHDEMYFRDNLEIALEQNEEMLSECRIDFRDREFPMHFDSGDEDDTVNVKIYDDESNDMLANFDIHWDEDNFTASLAEVHTLNADKLPFGLDEFEMLPNLADVVDAYVDDEYYNDDEDDYDLESAVNDGEYTNLGNGEFQLDYGDASYTIIYTEDNSMIDDISIDGESLDLGEIDDDTLEGLLEMIRDMTEDDDNTGPMLTVEYNEEMTSECRITFEAEEYGMYLSVGEEFGNHIDIEIIDSESSETLANFDVEWASDEHQAYIDTISFMDDLRLPYHVEDLLEVSEFHNAIGAFYDENF